MFKYTTKIKTFIQNVKKKKSPGLHGHFTVEEISHNMPICADCFLSKGPVLK